jgi:hypothetical protein
LLAVAPTAVPTTAATDVWQYSVRVGTDPTRRAYLWIPENNRHVRAILIGIQNMLEESMFEDLEVRKAIADSGMAIVWITPHDDLGDSASPFQKFNPPNEIAKQVQTILDRLAEVSGYPEIATAPLLPTAHSAATPFVWGMGAIFGPTRVMALLPYKGWFTGHIPPGIPTLHVSSEYGEVGGINWGETYLSDRVQIVRLRSEAQDRLIGDSTDIGAGHFEWNSNFSPIVAMFIRKAAAARLPTGDATGLKAVDAHTGWVIAPDTLGTAQGIPVPYDTAGESAAKDLWYFDREMAETINNFMVEGLTKKPQVIDFVEDGQPVDLKSNGFAILRPILLKDGVSFQVKAMPLDVSPIANLYKGAAVGHAKGPIQFRVSTGELKQNGPDTFQVWRRRGGLVQQGPPWEPWIMAVQPGDAKFRRADRPARPQIPVVLFDGKDQNLAIAKIPDQPSSTRQITLKGTSDAGLPVQFFDEDGTTLHFLPIPPNSRFPVEVVIGAYQWGRITDPIVKTASVEMSFHITQYPER